MWKPVTVNAHGPDLATLAMSQSCGDRDGAVLDHRHRSLNHRGRPATEMNGEILHATARHHWTVCRNTAGIPALAVDLL